MPSPPRTINDIQSDMAGHDDEGSGHITDDVDDEEYRLQGSGDGSGDGKYTPHVMVSLQLKIKFIFPHFQVLPPSQLILVLIIMKITKLHHMSHLIHRPVQYPRR